MKKFFVFILLLIPSFAFAQLGGRSVTFSDLQVLNPPATYDGQSLWCKDCNATSVCSGGGPGAFAISKNNAWNCSLVGGSSQVGINVDNFGAKGDGITDDAGAICTAYKTVPSKGVLTFTANKTYLVNSNPGSHFYACDVTPTPVSVNFSGATIIVGTGVAHAIFGVAQGTLYSALTGKLINAAHRGDTTITTTTAADASSFSVGHVIYCHGEVSDNLDRTEDIATSVDPATGIIGLQWPLGKELTSGTPACADADAVTLRDISYKNGSVRWATGATAQFAVFTQIYNLLFDHLNIDASLFTVHEPLQGNSNINTVWTNNICVTANVQGGCIELGASGSVQGYASNNTVRTLGAGSDVLGSCEGCEAMTVVNNLFYSLGSGTSNEMLDLSTSYDFILSNNYAEYGGTGAMAAGHAIISTNSGAGPALNAIVSANNIVSYFPTGIISKGTNDKILGNTITTTKTGIDVAAVTFPEEVIGNTVDLRGTITGIGIQLEALQGAETSTVANNIIQGDPFTSGTCVFGVALNDPGSVKTWIPTITGNNLVGCTTPVQYNGSASSNLPKRSVTGNGGVTDSFLFADIGNVLTVNGQQKYCSDCAIANPCTGSSNGAIAKRLNGVNVCN